MSWGARLSQRVWDFAALESPAASLKPKGMELWALKPKVIGLSVFRPRGTGFLLSSGGSWCYFRTQGIGKSIFRLRGMAEITLSQRVQDFGLLGLK